MKYALDNLNNRVRIDEANKNGIYYCQVCGEKLFQKRGIERAPHFSHYKGAPCNDHRNYDTSLWADNWKSKSNKDEQEVVVSYKTEKHLADVLIEDKKLVVEFLNDLITRKEFNDRNTFFKNAGYDVNWVINISSFIDEGKIKHVYRTDSDYEWERPPLMLKDYKLGEGIQIYFEYFDNKTNKRYLTYVTDFKNENFKYFQTHKKLYDDTKETEILHNKLIKTDFGDRKFSVFEFWDEYNPKCAIFRNVETGYYIKINKNPYLQKRKYGEVYGYFSRTKKFTKESKQLYFTFKKIWICERCLLNNY